MSLIFELAEAGPSSQVEPCSLSAGRLPERFLRQTPAGLPRLPEAEVVHHYTRLAQKNFCADTHFYPLGSCTMKHNPKLGEVVSRLPGFSQAHPLMPPKEAQGVLEALFDLQEMLCAVTKMDVASLAPMAGAQGELAAMLMTRAWHEARGELRRQVIVPDTAHGTNPASARMAGFEVVEVPTAEDGNIDVSTLRKALCPDTAAFMITYPSTLGLFEENLEEVIALVHSAGGLVFLDGANLNALMGFADLGALGFDLMHINLHKTFATPHGSGGPGAGPVLSSQALSPFLPIPRVVKAKEGFFVLDSEQTSPRSIGKMGAFHGQVGVALRAWAYLRLLGEEGLRQAAKTARANAAYLRARLVKAGFEAAYPQRQVAHEFCLSLASLKKETGVGATEVAKRLLDKGFYAPTVHFPQKVPECLLIEPTETVSRATLDAFVQAMEDILREARENPEIVRTAPHGLPAARLDEAGAARHPDLVWQKF